MIKFRLINTKLRILNQKSTLRAFTIIELLVVIIVIGILVSITVVSYSGISSRVMSETIKQDLNDASSRLKKYYYDHGSYPASLTDNCPSSDASDAIYCLKPSPGDNYSYNTTSPYLKYCLTAAKSNQSSFITQEGTQISGPCPVLYIDAGIQTSFPGSGTTWNDLSGQGNDAVMYSCTLFDSCYPDNHISAGALVLDGTVNGGYAAVSDPTDGSLDFGSESFTVGAWIKFSAYGRDYRDLIFKGAVNGTGYPGWRFGMSTTGVPHILIEDNLTLYKEGDLGTTPVGLNEWHFLVIVYNRTSNAIAYIDGVKVGILDISTKNGSVNNAENVNIGFGYPTGMVNFSGQIGAVYMYNTALGDAEIKNNFDIFRIKYGV